MKNTKFQNVALFFLLIAMGIAVATRAAQPRSESAQSKPPMVVDTLRQDNAAASPATDEAKDRHTIQPTGLAVKPPKEPKSRLDLSLHPLPLDDEGPRGGGGEVVLSDKDRRLIEKLKPSDPITTPFPPATKNEENVSVGGSVLTQEPPPNPSSARQSPKDYLDSIEGAKVNLDVKF